MVNNAGKIVSVSDKVCESHNAVTGVQAAGYDSCVPGFVDYNRDCDNVLGDTCGLSSRSLMWSFVSSSDRQYFTSYATSLVTLSGSKSKLSVTDILSGFHQFDMSDMLPCSNLELTTGHNGGLQSKVNSHQSSGCDSSLKLVLSSESKSLLLTDVEQFHFSGQMDFLSSVVTIGGDFYLLCHNSNQQWSTCNTKSFLGSSSGHGSFVGILLNQGLDTGAPSVTSSYAPPPPLLRLVLNWIWVVLVAPVIV